MSCKSFQCGGKRIRNRVEIMIHRCLGANEKEERKSTTKAEKRSPKKND